MEKEEEEEKEEYEYSAVKRCIFIAQPLPCAVIR